MPGAVKNKTQTKFWNMAKSNGSDAEITLYGDICHRTPMDWWTGEKIEGQYITPEGFLEDLEVIKDAANITIKLNSCGGDLFTGIAIHNALKTLKGKKTVVVEGVAASAASVIMCCGDTIEVYPGSLIMIHGVAASFWDFMTIDDLQKHINAFEAGESAIAEIYAVKTGMEVEELRKMMKAETWMTGSQALDFGFADEVIGGADLEFNYVNKNVLLVNGVQHDLSGFKLPKNILQNKLQKNQKKEGGVNTMDEFQKFMLAIQQGFKSPTNKADDAEDGKKKSEDEDGTTSKCGDGKKKEQEAVSAEEIKNAVEAERTRLKEIDELPSNISAELVAEAKYGPTACSASELALRALKAQAQENSTQLNNITMDAKASGAESVKGQQNTSDKEGDDKVEQARQFAKERRARKENK